MKTLLASLITLGTFAASIIVGAVFFSPNGSATTPIVPATSSAANIPGSVTVVVTDQEGDAVEKAEIIVKDASAATTGKAATTDINGKALVHLPGDGFYALHTSLPADYMPRTDIDEQQLGLCMQTDTRLCITVELAQGTVSLVADKTPRSEVTVGVTDKTPEPRIVIDTLDDSGQPLAGGSVTITRKRDGKVVWAEPHNVATEITHQLASDTYTVAWIPPTTHHRMPSHTVTLSVQEKRVVRLSAIRKTPAVVPTPTPGIQVPGRTMANVSVVDAQTGSAVDGGSIAVTFSGPNGTSLRLRYSTSNGQAAVSLGSAFELDYTAPTGYKVVGTAHAMVGTGQQQSVRFTVTKENQDRVAQDPIFEPAEEAPLTGNQLGSGQSIIPIPVEEVEPQEVMPAPQQDTTSDPIPEPTPDPTPEATPEPMPEPSEDVISGSSDDALEADCYMYLELYPELVELDAYLATYCGENPSDALQIINELLTELGQ